jgi:uncharacterized membrane protein YfcA
MTGFMELTFFESTLQIIIISSIIFLSQFIYSAIGFGAGMFAISLLTLIYGDISFFVPFFVMLCFPTETYISLKDRKQIDFRHNWKFLLFIVPALFFGAFILDREGDQSLQTALGVVIIILSVYYLFFEHKISLSLKSRLWFLVFGGISGFLGGLFGMAGPPLIFYFKSIKLGKREFRVALLSLFLAMTFFRLIFYYFLDNYSWKMLYSAMFMIPFVLLGLLTGVIAHDRIPEEKFKTVTSVVLFICGILIVLKNSFSPE